MRDIVCVGAGEHGMQGNAPGIGYHVYFSGGVIQGPVLVL